MLAWHAFCVIKDRLYSNQLNTYTESRLFALKVLLVDDDAGSLRGMQLALFMLKHICDAYSDPCEAVKNYPNHTYDLVITDIYMPTIDGFTLAKTIRCVNPKAKIIFISDTQLK